MIPEPRPAPPPAAPAGSMDLASFERLVRVETKLDVILVGDSDHETRIRALERARWKSAGLAGLVSGPLAALVALAINYVQGGTP